MLGNELQRFAQNSLVLGYSATERASIDRSIEALKDCLNRKLNIPYCDMIVFGSYTRNTILPRAYDPDSDIDILVAMDQVNYWSRQDVEVYRRNLKSAIAGTYSTSFVVRDFPCVKLELNHIKFDVVPALKEETNYGVFYRIPNKSLGWTPTEPNDINGSLEASNKAAGGNKLRNLIRLCKHCNASRWSKALESYNLEKEIMRNYQFWSSAGVYGYDSFLEIFLNAIDGLSYQTSDGESARSCVKYVRDYLHSGDENGQRKWIKHLLPNFT